MDPEPQPLPEPTVAAEGARAGSPATSMRDICPFLLAADGNWRSIDPTGEHRCTAVFPPARLTTEKQRRLCLVAAHETCATFAAALAVREPAIERDAAATRPMPRTTPVITERGRFALPVLSMRPDRTAGQAALVILLCVAFAGIVFAQLGPGRDGSPGRVGSSPSPAASAAAVTAAPSDGAVIVSPTPAEETSPTPGITLVPTEDSPAPSSSTPATYTVERGDTLSGIASVYGTTWQVLAELNDIKNPSALRVGTVLQLP